MEGSAEAGMAGALRLPPKLFLSLAAPAALVRHDTCSPLSALLGISYLNNTLNEVKESKTPRE
jgi:hypothetical protein